MPKTLYLCYFGMREPLVQTQVLPYLRELQKLEIGGRESEGGAEEKLQVSLLTFEPQRGEVERAEFEKIRSDLLAEGIEWDWLPYHKRPSALATAWDIARGAFFIWRRIKRFDVLHGRVHVPTLMGALARKLSRHRPKLLFDIRGFFPEEYTDAGIWPEGGLLYRGAKRIENWLMKEADGFVVLTEKAREVLFPESRSMGFDKTGRPVEVIPCCVDFRSRFSGTRETERRRMRDQMGIDDRFVLTHIGALGGLYLISEIADLFSAARKTDPKAFALVLTQGDPTHIEKSLLKRGFKKTDYYIGRVSPSEIENYLYASDVGISIVKKGYATQSRSPTKIPEYLAAGLPVIANEGVGDIDNLMLEEKAGSLIHEFSTEGYCMAIQTAKQFSQPNRLREVSQRLFDVQTVGGENYRRIYERLLR